MHKNFRLRRSVAAFEVPCLGLRNRSHIFLCQGRQELRTETFVRSSSRGFCHGVITRQRTGSNNSDTALFDVQLGSDPKDLKVTIRDGKRQQNVMNISRSYGKKPPENLIKSLLPLLGYAETKQPMSRKETDRHQSTPGFSSPDWLLHPDGHAISKHFTVQESKSVFTDKVKRILTELGDKENHHASVSVMEADLSTNQNEETSSQASNSQLSLVTITCTTHVPRGLSMKDVKLAREIDKLLLENSQELGILSRLQESSFISQMIASKNASSSDNGSNWVKEQREIGVHQTLEDESCSCASQH